MGRTGVCWDNAQAESFFARLKIESIYRTTITTINDARDRVARYIEIFYNRRRRHSGLDYEIPYLNRPPPLPATPRSPIAT